MREWVFKSSPSAGGYAIVLEVKCTAGTNERLALKRVAVNSEQDLYLCRQEIAILVSTRVTLLADITNTKPQYIGNDSRYTRGREGETIECSR